MKLAVISWGDFCREIHEIERGLDTTLPGEQTLQRLLAGLRAQIEVHKNTGLDPANLPQRRGPSFVITDADVEFSNDSGSI